MEQKRIEIESYLKQRQEFEIAEYENHIELDRFLSEGIELVEIPASINGKPVTTVGDDCFFNCADIKKVSIPESVEIIGAQAFALCKGITEMILPDSVTEIGHHAFRDCRGLKKVVLPKNLKVLSSGLFSFCYLHDPEILLPERLEVIESGAFWSAGSFELVIPDSVKEIGVGAFNWGPHPITKLPENKGWYLQWPYGETVISFEAHGRITDLHFLEGNCMLHEVTFEFDIKNFVYPCDYLDGNLAFEDEKNRQGFEADIAHNWSTDKEIADAYKIRDAWRKGLLAPKV